MVQLAIDSAVSRNNLTAFANALGGQAIALDRVDSIPEMRTKLKKALNVSGFSNNFPLEHCFDKLPGFKMSWEEIEDNGIDFHQAMLLYQKDWLTWMPIYSTSVSALQYAELRFLYSLYFKTSIPSDLVNTMLAQLKKPYYYSFDCIYWDFAKARWSYFVQQNKIQQLPNEASRFEDFSESNSLWDIDRNDSYYDEGKVYEVDTIPTDKIKFELNEIDFSSSLREARNLKILNPGDKVVFKKS